MCEIFPTPSSPALPMPAASPTVPFHSSSPESAQTLQVTGSVPQDCPRFRHRLQILRCHLGFWLTGCTLGFPQHPSEVMICYKRSQHWGKQVYWLIIKDIYLKDTDEEPEGEVHRVRGRRVPITGVPVPVELGPTALPAHGCVPQPRSSPKPFIWDFYGGSLT